MSTYTNFSIHDMQDSGHTLYTVNFHENQYQCIRTCITASSSAFDFILLQSFLIFAAGNSSFLSKIRHLVQSRISFDHPYQFFLPAENITFYGYPAQSVFCLPMSYGCYLFIYDNFTPIVTCEVPAPRQAGPIQTMTTSGYIPLVNTMLFLIIGPRENGHKPIYEHGWKTEMRIYMPPQLLIRTFTVR